MFIDLHTLGNPPVIRACTAFSLIHAPYGGYVGKSIINIYTQQRLFFFFTQDDLQA